MGRVFRNKSPIPIPREAYVDKHMKVFVTFRGPKGERIRYLIGRAISRTHMFSNTNFKQIYPQLWDEYYGNEDNHAEPTIKVGLYAILLGISWDNALYPTLCNSCGIINCNMLMDFAQHGIINRSSTAMILQDYMQDRMSFSQKWPNDTLLSKMFCHDINSTMIYKFKTLWIEQCIARGVTSAWLSIDSSNHDSALSNSFIAEPGLPKSGKGRGKGIKVISYIWAVSTSDGLPITYEICSGGTPDCKMIETLINRLATANIHTEGVILDRGFAFNEVLSMLSSLNIDIIVKLKNSNFGYTEMIKRHGDEIRLNFKYLICSDTDKSLDGWFGITDQIKPFNNSKSDYCIGLYFDLENYSPRLMDFITTLLNEYRRLVAQIKDLEASDIIDMGYITISPKVREYINVGINDSGKFYINFNEEKCQNVIDYQKGFTAIASSKVLPLEDILKLYTKRDISEKAFAALKTFVGSHVIRSHSDPALNARMLAYFVTSILHVELINAIKSLDQISTKMIPRLDKAVLEYMSNQTYIAPRKQPKDVKLLLGLYGYEEKDFDAFAEEASIIAASGHLVNPMRIMPSEAMDRMQQIRHTSSTQQEAELMAGFKPKTKRSRGRPPGSKNKQTHECDTAGFVLQPKRNRGRPPGSKNKRTLERDAATTAATTRRRGRPPGSKNKPKTESNSAEKQTQTFIVDGWIITWTPK